MTPKQEERIRKKIARIRKELAADKKRWGGFHHDGSGLRYLPPKQFIKLRDYKGGLRYLRWFNRTFSDDVGNPFFLFEWTLIFFKTGKWKEAENKALETFASNSYLFDQFLGKELLPIQKEAYTNLDTVECAAQLSYSKSEAEFADFGAWLEEFQTSEKFRSFTQELISIDKKLATNPAHETRLKLIARRSELIDEL